MERFKIITIGFITYSVKTDNTLMWRALVQSSIRIVKLIES